MEIVLLLRVLLRRWWLIALPVVIVAALTLPGLLDREPAAPLSYTITLEYSAAQSLNAIPRTEGDYQDIWLSSELTVNAFTDWVRGSRFADEAITAAAERGVTITTGRFNVVADNERSVGRIIITWSNSAEIGLIADAVLDVLQNRSAAYFAQLGGEPATVTLLSRSSPTPAAPPLTDRFGPVLRAGLGLAAGIALALLAHYLDPALRRREDVEALGIPVIAAIPK
jgi:capsular polysaccharide biosynthesis protein